MAGGGQLEVRRLAKIGERDPFPYHYCGSLQSMKLGIAFMKLWQVTGGE